MKDFRPIALMVIAYEIYMSILKEKKGNHIKENNEDKEVQAGFTYSREKGRRQFDHSKNIA